MSDMDCTFVKYVKQTETEKSFVVKAHDGHYLLTGNFPQNSVTLEECSEDGVVLPDDQPITEYFTPEPITLLKMAKSKVHNLPEDYVIWEEK